MHVRAGQLAVAPWPRARRCGGEQGPAAAPHAHPQAWRASWRACSGRRRRAASSQPLAAVLPGPRGPARAAPWRPPGVRQRRACQCGARPLALPTLAMARQDAILLTGHMCSVTCAAIARCEPQGLVPGCPAGYIERPLVQGRVRSVGARCTSTLPPVRCDYNITFDIVNYAHV